MRNVTSAFLRAIQNDLRVDYVSRAVITLTNGTVLRLSNENILSDGIKIEDAVSSDNAFQVGAAIINQATVVINNIYNDYDEYDFDGASVVLYTGLDDLDDGHSCEVKLGTFTVDEPEYDSSVITLKCLDNMVEFDKPYDTALVYPATLRDIVTDACTKCGVTLATNSLQFPHYDYIVTNKPSDESTTYRQVISWAAQIAVCFARCDRDGELEFGWYNTSILDNAPNDIDGGIFDSANPYATGDNADGGTFNPWNNGTDYDGGDFNHYPEMHFITSAFSNKLSTDDVVITGVKVIKKIETEGSDTSYVEYTYGQSGYVIIVEKNDFIDGDHGQDVANWMGLALTGLTFRKADITHPSNPSIEAGDVAYFWDHKGNRYSIIVSSTSFSTGSSQNTKSSAESPAKNSQTRFSESTRNYVEMRKQMKKQYTTFETARQALSRRIDNAKGLYETDITVDGATQHWCHDRPILRESEVVMAFTTAGITVCNDYASSLDDGRTPSWYGLTVDGTFLASVINTIALFFDYASGGTLTLGGQNNINGVLRILDASGNQVGLMNNTGADLTGNIVLVNKISNSNNIVKCNLGSFQDVVKSFVQLQTLYGLDIHNEGNNSNYFRIATYHDSQYSTNRAININSNSQVNLTSSINAYNDYGFGFLINKTGFVVTSSSSFNQSPLSIGEDTNGDLRILANCDAKFEQSLTVSGTKNRVVKTDDYSDRLLYCYETSSPMFGDIGEGIISDDGTAYVEIDPVFSETVNTNQYQVFLQSYGNGQCYVTERKSTYFIVKGSPNLSFGWEIKAKQADYDQLRLENPFTGADIRNSINYGSDAIEHIQTIAHDREVQ